MISVFDPGSKCQAINALNVNTCFSRKVPEKSPNWKKWSAKYIHPCALERTLYN
jgi:hypothetical protein